MDSTFIFSKPVSDKHFIGRATECQVLANLIAQGENVVIYEPPCTGISSLLSRALFSLKARCADMITASVSLLNVRTQKDLATALGSAILAASGSSPEEYAALAEAFLGGTHLVFDRSRYNLTGEIISLTWDPDDDDFRALFMLPYRISAGRSRQMAVIFEHFDNIMETEDGERLCKLLEGVFKEKGTVTGSRASYVFTGSRVNAMNWIFGIKRFFYRQCERVRIGEIDTREIIEYVARGFLVTGKVVDKDLLLGACKLFRNNIWYINTFAYFCDSLSRGYIMENILAEALEYTIALNRPRFIATMDSLTTFQISLLRAILEGNTKFSSSEVIQKYGLNSSANVRRLKDALCKKEIVTFDENDIPVVLDPLFEYWAGKYYFNLKEQ